MWKNKNYYTIQLSEGLKSLKGLNKPKTAMRDHNSNYINRHNEVLKFLTSQKTAMWEDNSNVTGRTQYLSMWGNK